ncbi:hypothetical protein V6N11_060190 [Hibiscus sabdariffa]|uniref:Reverse transcriptase zinc-binding domain-containing protein n=1 Tax=Hibiscus sabdariffa TaxID=183260 RepID=A0ABR1Z8N1_9ROSI
MSPTRYNLYARRVVSGALCHICNHSIETIEHTFLDCELLRSVWYDFGYSWPSYVADYSFQDWLSWMFSNLSSVASPFAAEAKAALHAILFAIDLGFTSVILEGNKVAHILAKAYSLGPDDCFWVEDIPSVARAATDEDRRWLDPP